MISISKTNILIPFTSDRFSDQRYMNMLCELKKDDNIENSFLYEYSIDEDDETNFFNTYIKYKGSSSNFYIKSNPVSFNKYICNETDNATPLPYFMRLYFPLESVYTYIKGATKFLVEIYSYRIVRDENNKQRLEKLYLFSDILNSNNNLACSQFKDNGIVYQEYQDVRINVPELINNSEDWNGNINITIHVVDDEGDIIYNCNSTYPGKAVICSNKYINKYINLTCDLDYKNRALKTACNSSITDYLNSININNYTAICRVLVKDDYDEELYINKIYKLDDINQDFIVPFNDVFAEFTDWSTWKDGIKLVTRYEIYKDLVVDWDSTDPTPEEQIEYSDCMNIYIQSQTVSLTEDIFRFLLPVDRAENININLYDMPDFKVVNKIINRSVNVVQNTSGVSGVIKPVFYQTFPIEKIVVHRDVTQNVCINLDEYKSKASKLYIKICGNYFQEYSRTIDGVLFTINGSNITSNTGNYYICNENKEFITSGKYVCE